MIYELNEEIELTLNKYYSCFDDDWVQIVEDLELETIQKQLFELQNKKDELIEWILQNRANSIAKSNSLENEIKRLTELKVIIDKKIEKADNFIDFIIKKDYKDKPMVIWNWQVSYTKSSRTIIDDETKIPKKFKRYIPKQIIPASYVVDKNILKKELKDKKIKWVHIENILTLKIK